MNTSEVLWKLEEVVDHYVQELDRYTPEQLQRKPSPEEWSIGQMYNHLIDSLVRMQLHAIENCVGITEEIAEGKTEAGEQIFELGQFPPVQIKVPGQPQPPNPEDKEDVKQRLLRAIELAKQAEAKLASIPLTRKSPHPRLGHLAATEWLQLGEMHFRHHLHQKERLDQWLFRT